MATPFETYFDLSFTGAILYEPVHNAAGELVDFAFYRVNPAAQRLLNLPAQPGGTYLGTFPAVASVGFNHQRQAFVEEVPAEWEGSYQADGFDYFFRTRAQRTDNYLLVSFSTLTEQSQQQADEALRQRQAREQAASAEAEAQRAELHHTLMQAPFAVAIFRGPDFVVELANAGQSELWGCPPEQVLGRPLFEALPSLAGQGLEEIFQQVLHTGQPLTRSEIPVRIARANTSLPEQGYFTFIYQPLRDAQGQLTGLMPMGVEVTGQVLARQQVQQLNEELAAINEELRASNEEYLLANTALSEAQQQLQQLNQELETRVQQRTHEAQAARAEAERQRLRLEQLVMQAPLAICVFDGPEWVYELVNPSYQRMFYGRELMGKRLVDALPEVADQPLMDILHAVYDTGVPFESREVLVPLARTAEGPIEDIFFNLTYQARFTERGQVDGFVTYAQDVTEEVLARQQVQVLNQELAAINEELTSTNEELHASNTSLTRTNVDLDNFIYTASHDLKTPISNIEGLLQLLAELLPDTGEPHELLLPILHRMQESVERFKRTIFHLTDVSKLQAEFAQPAVTLSLAAVVEDVRQDLLPQLTATHAQLAVAVAGYETTVFSAKNLRSLVFNLLSNALKYRHPARVPWVRVACACQGRDLVLTVQDNGLGIGEQQQKRLFQLFQRLHTHVEGTGVGLYTVKKIVENAGGTISVQSQEGIGTTFTLVFPA
ncbi:PAS domain-containing sensor histidine kinase [Hymenobacter setariae]|uniref:PAS domain-containing sensor histidine kinase n=1 Tax=Hymenobacter setariae TaxID=2594794 RepID=UPI001F3E4310|nr:PAS domain-containing sensor histidine kinase [Hymenobacter setariae]